jgi:hypothetical protein
MFDISKETENAIFATWDSISADAYEICEGDNEIAVELVLDANRLSMNGYAAADAEIRQLCVDYGFGTVREQLSKKMRLL